MNFETFLHLITRVACEVYPAENGSAVESFHRLLYDHMLPLWEEIMKNPNQRTLYILQNEIQFDELLEFVIKRVGPVVYTIYAAYFPWELTTSKDTKTLKKRSEKSFFDFLSQFDLCPDLLTKTIAF